MQRKKKDINIPRAPFPSVSDVYQERRRQQRGRVRRVQDRETTAFSAWSHFYRCDFIDWSSMTRAAGLHVQSYCFGSCETAELNASASFLSKQTLNPNRASFTALIGCVETIWGNHTRDCLLCAVLNATLMYGHFSHNVHFFFSSLC